MRKLVREAQKRAAKLPPETVRDEWPPHHTSFDKAGYCNDMFCWQCGHGLPCRATGKKSK